MNLTGTSTTTQLNGGNTTITTMASKSIPSPTSPVVKNFPISPGPTEMPPSPLSNGNTDNVTVTHFSEQKGGVVEKISVPLSLNLIDSENNVEKVQNNNPFLNMSNPTSPIKTVNGKSTNPFHNISTSSNESTELHSPLDRGALTRTNENALNDDGSKPSSPVHKNEKITFTLSNPFHSPGSPILENMLNQDTDLKDDEKENIAVSPTVVKKNEINSNNTTNGDATKMSTNISETKDDIKTIKVGYSLASSYWLFYMYHYVSFC